MFPGSSEKRRASSPIRGSVNSSTFNSPPRRFSSPHQSPATAPIHYSDRYIPSRTGSSLENSFDLMTRSSISNTPQNTVQNTSDSENNNTRIMNTLIRAELLGQGSLGGNANSNKRGGSGGGNPNVLRYRSSDADDNINSSGYPRSAHSSPGATFHNFSSDRLSLTEVKKTRRKISRIPYKVLDAPALEDDFYLNLIDWSSSNVLAVGLGSSVYIWSAHTSKVTKLHDFGDSGGGGGGQSDSVTSVCWMGGTHLVVGMNSGNVEVWDAGQEKCVRKMESHTARVGALAWSPQSSILASGSRDRRILLQDVKVKGTFDPMSPASSPYYAHSPYHSCSSPFSRRHSSPVPLYASREAKISSVLQDPSVPFRAGSGVDFATSFSPSTSTAGGEGFSVAQEDIGVGRDSPPLHQQVFSSSFNDPRVRSHEKSSWSIFDPDDTVDHFLTVPPTPVPVGCSGGGIVSRATAASSAEMRALVRVFDHDDDDDDDRKEKDEEGDIGINRSFADDEKESFMDICEEEEEQEGQEEISSRLHFSPPPPPIPLHRPASSSCHSTPIRFSSRASYPESPASVHSNTTAAPCRIRELQAHKQEVCGLKWSFDEKQLASGGNDNKLLVWNLSGTGENNSNRSSRVGAAAGAGQGTDPEFRFCDHTAAVKAIAWSPHQSGLLASGGGTADRTIRFWNTSTGTALQHMDTGSQVCNLMWARHVNEIVSTHGYSLNQIAIWRYPSMQKIATLTGHTYRVLYLAMSPDGQSIVTGAGDETLRFWNVFPGPKPSFGSGLGSTVLFPSGGDIR